MVFVCGWVHGHCTCAFMIGVCLQVWIVSITGRVDCRNRKLSKSLYEVEKRQRDQQNYANKNIIERNPHFSNLQRK